MALTLRPLTITSGLLITALVTVGVTVPHSASALPDPSQRLAFPSTGVQVAEHDEPPLTLGVRFSTAVDGQVTGVEFYRDDAANEATAVQLWAPDGNQLASATAPATNGWVHAWFDEPVDVTAGQTYTASYFADPPTYSWVAQGFGQPRTTGDLSVAAGGGVYRYGAAPGFPELNYENSDYLVTPIFSNLTEAAPRLPVLGVYKDGACALVDPCAQINGPAGTDSYAAWLGNDVRYGQDNTGNEAGGPTWQYFEQGWPDSFSQWRDWKAQVPGRRLVLAMPMFLQLDDQTNAQRITTCATGGYDDRYRALATNLGNNNLGDTIVRIGWEAHFDGLPWSYSNNPTDWRACWRRIATQMSSVEPGLVMNWNMGDREAMRAAVDLRGFENFYPGDDVVDEIGIDTYNVNGANQDYDSYFGTEVGNLGWYVQIATERNKPLSLPEWGLWDNRTLTFPGGSGDDVEYIELMHAWMSDPANRVAWASYFDYNVGDYPVHQLQPDWRSGTVFPNASARFRELFGS